MICSRRRLLAILITLSTSLPASLAQSPPKLGTEDESLIGIWSNETKFATGLSGELTVSRRRSGWRANISNAESTSEGRDGSVRFRFPGGGEFRGRLGKNSDSISGFWLQPAAGADASGLTDPGGSGQSFASPLTLRRTRANTWKAIVKPLDRHFTLFLKISRNPDGSLVAAFRNPEANSIGGALQYRVALEGNTVIFAAGSDPAKPSIRFTASRVSSPERLRIRWADLGGSIDLIRRETSAATNFFPRPPGEPKYVYRKPSDTGDGWTTARAGDAGVDEALLARLGRP